MSGTARVAFREETSFGTADADGDWIQPGMNITVSEFNIENNQTRNRQPDDTTPDGSRVGNFVGTASLSWDLTDDKWHTLIPFRGTSNNLAGQGGAAPTAEWFFEATALDDTDTQFTQGLTVSGAITQADIEYTEGEPISVSVTVDFGALSSNSPAADAIIKPSNADIYTRGLDSSTLRRI